MRILLPMRRVLSGLLLAIVIAPLAPLAAHAAKPWPLFSNKHLGFSVRYPPGWKVAAFDQLQNKQVTMISSGKVNYALNVTILPLRPGKTRQATKNVFVSFEARSQHNPIFQRVPWSATTLGGRTASVTLIKPSTEGGVGISSAVYVVPWRNSLYEITLTAYKRLSRLGQFPALYGQILRTWRFL
jgi:hypothetical protein